VRIEYLSDVTEFFVRPGRCASRHVPEALIPTALTIDPPAGIAVREVSFPPALDLRQRGVDQPLAVFGSVVYALTSICSVAYINSVESVFEILAEPNRRAILRLLVSSQQSVGEIERRLRMPQPTVSKHLRVLRDAGFVESTVDAQRRLYRLKIEPLQEVDAWLAPFRRFWSAHVDALERHLDRIDQSTRTKKKTRRKR
jgi:DNA-binding transcriptional ArsR family regulator